MKCFQKIIESNPKQDGWCTLNKALTLASIVVSLRPKVSIEIGLYAGRSFTPIALAHQEVGGKAIGIDPWSAKDAVVGYTGENEKFWNNPANMERVKGETFKWVNHFGLSSCVEIIQKPSDEVAPVKCGLLHVDGQHTIQSLNDVRRFSFEMDYGSIIVMDDVNWKNDGVGHVQTAVQWILDNGWVKLYDLEEGAVFQRGIV